MPGEAQETESVIEEGARRWRRYGGLSGAAVLVLLAIALMALPLLVSSEKVRQRILSEAEAITGRSISFRDPPRIMLNPFLGIEIENVILAGSGAAESEPPLLHAEKLHGRLEILPALIGQIRVQRYQLVRPRFSMRVRTDGSTNWSMGNGRVWNVLEKARTTRANTAPGAAPDLTGLEAVGLGEFEIVDGAGEYLDERNGTRETISNINGQVAWRSTAAPAAISSTAIWRGEALQIDGRLGQPLELLAGGSSPMEFKLASEALTASFKGKANLLANLQLRGAGSIQTPSVRRFMELAGDPLEPGPAIGGFSVSGQMEATRRLVAFAEAEIAVDGNAGRGSLQIALPEAGAPKVSGTLSIGSLDLRPYVSALKQDGADGRNVLDRLSIADHVEFDLRLSATNAMLGEAKLADVAATFAMRAKEMLIDIGNASAMGGSMTAKLSVRRTGGQASFETKAIFAGLDARQASAALFAESPYQLTGTLTGEASARSYGADHAELLDKLAGSVELELTNGEFAGLDFAKLRQHAAKRQIPADMALGGQTAFRRIVAGFDLYRNLVLVRELTLSNSKLEARMSGKAALGPGGIAMRIDFAEPATVAKGAEAPNDNPVFVGGTFAAPLFSLAAPADAMGVVE